METMCENVAAWFSRERPIEVRDDVTFSVFSFDGDVGIMLGAGEAELDVKENEAAFLFGKDKDELWFMPYFGMFLKVATDLDEKVAVAKLYERFSGVYKNFSFVKEVSLTVPVYHNALYMVPFDGLIQAHENDMDASAQTEKSNGMFMDENKDEKELKNEVEKHLTATEVCYEEIKESIDTEVGRFDGDVIVRYRPGNDRLYSYDIIRVKNRLFALIYAEFDGEWLADEEIFNGESPLWFSETSHAFSPVLQASRLKVYLENEFPEVEIVVVCPQNLIIVNEDEEQVSCEKLGVKIAWAVNDLNRSSSLKSLINKVCPSPEIFSESDRSKICALSIQFCSTPKNFNHDD